MGTKISMAPEGANALRVDKGLLIESIGLCSRIANRIVEVFNIETRLAIKQAIGVVYDNTGIDLNALGGITSASAPPPRKPPTIDVSSDHFDPHPTVIDKQAGRAPLSKTPRLRVDPGTAPYCKSLATRDPKFLTATQLAERIGGVDARTVNILLVEAGLLRYTAKGHPAPTETGKWYGSYVYVDKKKTCEYRNYHFYWFERVIPVIERLMTEIAAEEPFDQ